MKLTTELQSLDGAKRRIVRELLAWLKARYPTRTAGVVSVVPSAKLPTGRDSVSAWQPTWVDDKHGRLTHWRITLRQDASADALADGLLEEWAHALRAELPEWDDNRQHDPLFALVRQGLVNEWLQQT